MQAWVYIQDLDAKVSPEYVARHPRGYAQQPCHMSAASRGRPAPRGVPLGHKYVRTPRGRLCLIQATCSWWVSALAGLK